MNNTELKLICELIRNSRGSDRGLAKTIGVSQPTVTRTRTKLEKQGLIEYTGIPNVQELGFDIMAITFGSWKRTQYPDTRISAAREFAEGHPNLIFLSSGIGLDSDRVAISLHKDYSDYHLFLKEIKTDWGKYMDITGSFIISLSSEEPLRSITFKYFADCLVQQNQKLLTRMP